jgi:hypothetical protein
LKHFLQEQIKNNDLFETVLSREIMYHLLSLKLLILSIDPFETLAKLKLLKAEKHIYQMKEDYHMD